MNETPSEIRKEKRCRFLGVSQNFPIVSIALLASYVEFEDCAMEVDV